MRTAISLAVIVIFSLAGYFKSTRLSDRGKAIYYLICDLKSIEINMRSYAIPISETIKRTNNIHLKAFFECFISMLDNGSGIEKSWIDSVTKSGVFNSNTKSDISIINSFSSQIGMYDMEVQRKNISLFIERLEICLNEANDEYKRKGKLYKALGMLLGCALAIVIL